VVHSFKTPTKRELQHDNLWRHYVALPEKGKYSIFNRSHYENVLVTKVNPQFLFFEIIPGIKKEEDIPADFWDKRFNQIRNFEEHITQNGIIVFKFFLHLSKEEQRLRLLRRLEREDKHWKFSPGDLSERELWDKYLNYYEEAINKTALPYAPWYIIPADNKHTARYLVVKIIHEKNITPDFFDLKSGIAGEILQKFSTYLVRLAIVGDFVKYTSNSLNDFIFESNKGRHISFVSSCAEAIKILSNK
jgi:polyphosphate kinase 2 (PPK2 family)